MCSHGIVRHDLCRERLKRQVQSAPLGWASDSIGPFARHTFTAAAILTLNPPQRALNPIDLEIRRHRWHSLVFNCSVLTSDGYGVGIRLRASARTHTCAPRP